MKKPPSFSGPKPAKFSKNRNTGAKDFSGSSKKPVKKETSSELKMPRSFAPRGGKGKGFDPKPAAKTVTKTSKVFMFDGDNKPKRTRIKREEIVVKERKTERRNFDRFEKSESPKSFRKKNDFSDDRKSFGKKEEPFKKTGPKRPEKSSFRHGDKPAFGTYKPANAKSRESVKTSVRKDYSKPGTQRKEAFHKDRKQTKTTHRDAERNDGLIRLNKFIANSGICSRREADTLIQQGLISVNGKVVTEVGTKVKREDVVKYNGSRIKPEALVYILLNKPKDYITTTDDDKGRKTVMDLVADASPERLFPVGRLDRNTTGVLLLTNDGDVAQALTHPKFQIKKVYHAVLDKKVSGDDLNKLVEGVHLEDGLVRADAVAYVEKEDKRHVGVEIHSGKNRVVRRMFEHLGYDVEKLDRVSFGDFTKKNVDRGRYRFLNEREIMYLMKLKNKL